MQSNSDSLLCSSFLGKILKFLIFITILGIGFSGYGYGTLVEGSPTTVIEEKEDDFGPSLPSQQSVDQLYLIPSFSSEEAVKTIMITATGYSSTPDQTDDTPFITASGRLVYPGVVAANFLPFGTKVRFPELFGDKIFVVEDRMHQRFQDGRVDIWFSDRAMAEEFGKKVTVMEILDL